MSKKKYNSWEKGADSIRLFIYVRVQKKKSLFSRKFVQGLSCYCSSTLYIYKYII